MDIPEATSQYLHLAMVSVHMHRHSSLKLILGPEARSLPAAPDGTTYAGLFWAIDHEIQPIKVRI